MITVLARYSAILSALLASLGTAVWILHGAPDLPKLTLAWHTVATDFLYDMRGLAHWASRLALILISPSLLLSAFLALFLLLRGSDTAYIRYLGVGLGWWSLGLFYMAVLPALPGAMSWPIPVPLLVCADVVMMLMCLGAAYAFMQFWAAYPRRITSEELSAFLVDKARRDLAARSPWRQRLTRLIKIASDADWIEKRARRYGALNRAIFTRHLRPGPLAIAVALSLAVLAGLLWRAEAYMQDQDLANTLGMVPFTILLFICMLPSVNLANIFRMHRATGSAAERRKVEWVSASFWIALVIFFAFGILSNMPLIYLGIFGGDAVTPGMAFGLMVLQFLTPLLGPLLLLMALMVSIFYNGDVDPKLALRGVTVWAVLGVLLTLVFALVERSVAVKLSGLLGLPPQTGYVVAGALVAATFQPIRKLVEKHVNRFVERVLPAAGRAPARSERPARRPRKRVARSHHRRTV